MRKWLALLASAFLVFATTAAPAYAQPQPIAPIQVVQDDTDGVQVPIPMNCRVKNYTGIQCVWSSLSCLARYHNIPAAKNLIDKYKSYAGPGDVRRALDPIGVKYVMNTGTKNKQFLVDYCAKGWGAGIGLNGTHMVTLVHFKDGVVKIIDNSDPSLRIQSMSEDQFMRRWDGWAVVLIPPTPPAPPAPPAPLPLAPRPPSAIK